MCWNLIKYNLILILFYYYYYTLLNSPKLNLNLQEANVNEKKKADDDMEHRKCYFIMKKLMLYYQHPRLALFIMSLLVFLSLSFVFWNYYYLRLLCIPINFKALHIIKNRLLYRHWVIDTFYT